MNDPMNRIDERLRELEEWTRKDEDRIYERIKKLEEWTKNHEKEGDELEQRIMDKDKKPHKCPVCDGCGNDKGKIQADTNWEFAMRYASCQSCDGIGIVWG